MKKQHSQFPQTLVLVSDNWHDYELVDSGNGMKLERFGNYTFVRPEAQAMWNPILPEKVWNNAHAIFQGNDEEENGNHWEFRQSLPERWQIQYGDVACWVEPTPFRHMGIFPEHACQWDWMAQQIKESNRPIRVLNLFAYTGLSTLAMSAAGALVTHVDASKKVMNWARENQVLSKLSDRPIRWLIDDALKFTQRKSRRGIKYDALVIDPPKFGRGPKGEVWRLHESLPTLLSACKDVLSQLPLFIVLTTYAVKVSPISLYYLLGDIMSGYNGEITVGEMALHESSAGRLLSTAAFGRWRAHDVSK